MLLTPSSYQFENLSSIYNFFNIYQIGSTQYQGMEKKSQKLNQICFAIKPEKLVLKEKNIKFREYFKLKVNLKLSETKVSIKKANLRVTMEKGKAIFQHPCLYFFHQKEIKDPCSYYLILEQMNEQRFFVEKDSIHIPVKEYPQQGQYDKLYLEVRQQYQFSYRIYVGPSKEYLQNMLSKNEANERAVSKEKILRTKNQNEDKKGHQENEKKSFLEDILSCSDSEYQAYLKSREMLVFQKEMQKCKRFKPTRSFFFDQKGGQIDFYDQFETNEKQKPLLYSTLASQKSQQLVKKYCSPKVPSWMKAKHKCAQLCC